MERGGSVLLDDVEAFSWFMKCFLDDDRIRYLLLNVISLLL